MLSRKDETFRNANERRGRREVTTTEKITPGERQSASGHRSYGDIFIVTFFFFFFFYSLFYKRSVFFFFFFFFFFYDVVVSSRLHELSYGCDVIQ